MQDKLSILLLTELLHIHFTWTMALQAVIVACGLAGNVLINRKDPRGFCLWLVSNGLLVVTQVLTGMYLLMLLYVAYFYLSARGFVQWRKEEKVAPAAEG